jgi:AcrR family transcriptional regulator
MDDISRELGISKKTLYQHVEDKKDLVGRVLELEMELTLQFMEEGCSPEQNSIDELILVNQKIHSIVSSHNPAFYYDLKKYYPAVFSKWMNDRRKSMYRMLVRNLQRGKSEDLYRGNLNEEAIARLYTTLIEVIYEHEITSEESALSTHFIREIFLYHLHGICNQKGLDYLVKQKENIYQ